MPGSSAGDGGELGAGAFRRVYPEEFLRRFLRQGVRPDGRPLARGRPVSLEVGAAQVGAAASCLVRCGGTVALAGVHLGLREPEEDRPRQGRLTVEAALHPLAPPEARGWKAAQAEGAFTERLRGVLPDQIYEEMIARVPAGRAGRPDEIAGAVAFLCSEEGGFVTGSTLSINGGQHMY